MRAGGTPVPIPNTMVKPRTADGTMLATAWKSRRVPENFLCKRVLTVICGREGNFADADGRQRPEKRTLKTSYRERRHQISAKALRHAGNNRQPQMWARPQMRLDGIFDRARARERTAQP